MEKSKDKVDLKNTANDLEVLHAPLVLSKTFQRSSIYCPFAKCYIDTTP